jgi:thiamine biosynthesis protein ThiI
MDSPEICTELGGRILDAFPSLQVDVHNPEFTLYVEIRESNYLYSEKIYGHRGLPVGTAGKGMLLLSGGIDSPVAGYMMASRGMKLEAVYFHSYPYTSERAKEKVIDLARIVSHYAGSMILHVVDFTAIQLELYQNSRRTCLRSPCAGSCFRLPKDLPGDPAARH